MPLRVFTARLGLRDPDVLDVTRAGDSVFGPSWNLLGPIVHARRETGKPETPAQWARYAEGYLQEMRASHHSHESVWVTLLARPRVVLTCFCPDPARCHRTILARDILPKLGAEYAGELVPVSRKEMRRRAALRQVDLFPMETPGGDEAMGRLAPTIRFVGGADDAPAPEAEDKKKGPPMDARPRGYALAARGGPDGTGPAAFAAVVRLPDGARSVHRAHSTHGWSRVDMLAFAHHSFVELPMRSLSFEGVVYRESKNLDDHTLANEIADSEYEHALYEIDPAGHAKRALAAARRHAAEEA